MQNPSLLKENIESLLFQNEHRRVGDVNELTNRWRNRLVVLGSTATGNDLTDLGATPLEKETFLVSQHWNVAASLIRGRFVKRTGLMVDIGVIVFVGILSGLLTWKLRVWVGTVCVLAVTGLYVAGAFWLFLQWRWWVPVVLPAGGALLGVHAGLVAYRAIHEQRERRRVKGVFDRLVSPKVVHELLKAPRLTLGGERLEITVMFADIRGFTSMTDDSQNRAQEYVQSRKMSPDQARQHFDQEASDSLRTVNTYLSLIADEVKRFDGTLDKYIGDCVMAFWGAPTPEKCHALTCVRAAQAAQNAIHKLNHERIIANEQRTAENVRRTSQGEEPLPMLALLSVGIGINSGMATVGLVGSEAHILNYTVFGREVNVASRLQQNAGPGRIVISESTFLALQRDDPSLASMCREMPIALLKGIQGPVREYEVPVHGVAAAEA